MDRSHLRPPASDTNAGQPRFLRWCVGLVVIAAILASGNASASAPQATPRPTKKATMVCAGEAQRDIAGVLAIKPTSITKPTWIDRVYSCTYHYPTGSFTISVKQLRDRPSTITYFNDLGATLNRLPENVPLGDGAFLTPNGSAIVRKDNNVLQVDASQLPARFAKLQLVPANVASAVAMTILGCWKG